MAIGNPEVATMEKENTEAESSNGNESQLSSDLTKSLDLAEVKEDEKDNNQEEEDGLKGKSFRVFDRSCSLSM